MADLIKRALDARERWIVEPWRLWIGWGLMVGACALGLLTESVFATLVSLTIGMVGFGLIDSYREAANRELRLIRVVRGGRSWVTVTTRRRRR